MSDPTIHGTFARTLQLFEGKEDSKHVRGRGDGTTIYKHSNTIFSDMKAAQNRAQGATNFLSNFRKEFPGEAARVLQKLAARNPNYTTSLTVGDMRNMKTDLEQIRWQDAPQNSLNVLLGHLTTFSNWREKDQAVLEEYVFRKTDSMGGLEKFNAELEAFNRAQAEGKVPTGSPKATLPSEMLNEIRSHLKDIEDPPLGAPKKSHDGQYNYKVNEHVAQLREALEVLNSYVTLEPEKYDREEQYDPSYGSLGNVPQWEWEAQSRENFEAARSRLQDKLNAFLQFCQDRDMPKDVTEAVRRAMS